jgi:hypothetical protein
VDARFEIGRQVQGSAQPPHPHWRSDETPDPVQLAVARWTGENRALAPTKSNPSNQCSDIATVPQQAFSRADPSRKYPGDMWLEIGAARAEVQEALDAGTHCHSELISNAVRLARMESSISSYRGSSTQLHTYSPAHYNGDNVIVLCQAVHVPNMQACKHRAEVQDPFAGEGIAEKEGAELFWSVIL